MDAVAVGLGYREPWFDGLLALPAGRLEVLEVMVDDVLLPGPARRRARRLGGRFALCAHGVNLGIGDAGGLDAHYLDHVAEALRDLHARWYSEHLCFLRGGGVDLGHFAPLVDDAATRRVLQDNGAQLARAVDVPCLLENAWDVLGLGLDGDDPGHRLGLAHRRGLEAAGTGALLDLTNLLYQARNERFDPLRYLAAIDLDRVIQVHLAGGREDRGFWIDSHDRPIDPEARRLLGQLAPRLPSLRAVTLEWDADLPPLAVALEEVDRVADVLARAGRRPARRSAGSLVR